MTHSPLRPSSLIMRALLLPITLLLCFCHGYGQSIYFRHFEIENGLSNNTVITSLQDKDGFLWFGTSDGLNRFDGYDFKTFRIDPNPTTGSNINAIFYLYQDKKGTLWVGANKGLYYFNKQDESFTRLPNTQSKWVRTIQSDADNNLWFVEGSTLYKYDVKTKEVSHYTEPALKNVTTLYTSKDGTLWLGCERGVLARYRRSTQQFDYFHPSRDEGNYNNTIESICETSNDQLLIGTSLTGLKRIDISQGVWTSVPLLPNNEERLFVRNILRVSNTEYWVGTEAGLFIFDDATDSARHLHKITGDKYSLSDNAIYSLCKDQEGGIWAGTYFGGINYFPNHSLQFEKFYPQQRESALRGSVVREMVQDQYGKLWIGTEDKGLGQFDPSKQVFNNYGAHGKLAWGLPTNIHGLLADGDNLYVGTFENGLYVVNIPSNTIRQHQVAFSNNGLNSNYINLLYKTRQGAVWACTSNGIYRFDVVQKRFYAIEGLPRNCFYSAILQDTKGRIWIGTHDQGVFYIDGTTSSKLAIRYKGGHLFEETKVVNFLEDRLGYLWICTESGLFRMGAGNQLTKVYDSESGMPSNVVCSVLEDRRGNLWAATSKGLVLIDTSGQIGKVFRQSDGLLSNQFNHRSAFKDEAGNFYFGSLKGFVKFNPEQFVVNKHVPPIFFTRLLVYNKEVSTNSLYAFSENFILNSSPIQLPYHRSTFSLDFATLSYTSTENIEYAYMVEGMDEKWNFIGKDRRIHFNNLSPGDYVIKVKSTNGYGEWIGNEKRIAIEVTPPFWKTTIAYLIYAIVAAWLIYLFARFFYNRHKERQARRMELFAMHKEKELNQFKIDFFTKVAHEIRTPLTLIKAPMDKLFKSIERLPDLKHEVVVMNKNTDRLLTLINQLLDFRKVESGNYFLHTEPRDLVVIVEELFNNFQPKADRKGIDYSLVIEQRPIVCNIDEEGIIKIVGNLLDNAIKYCHSYIMVNVGLRPATGASPTLAVVRVVNDGDLIAEKDRVYIFDAFFSSGNSSQVESTGIGLSLARSLALLHKGSLEYSVDTSHNVFTFVVPLF
ncbi:sensor histidine kinase [Paraflavitalea sp. CAU 1676]|uniref:sensor histidine kinase n=1 Tax=Paraflavitalea sp. CAU 1676 TaxID=3032598 RepID=UPI0023DB3781|nr:sensor histidine kinase [Paraflavitalea sp. CAU 1676]MDF2191872.1 two-component regulator propeller domain-containing protein [Paraflavitalea sp. CAU 1676]